MSNHQLLINQIHALVQAQNDLIETLLNLVGDQIADRSETQLELPFEDDEPF